MGKKKGENLAELKKKYEGIEEQEEIMENQATVNQTAATEKTDWKLAGFYSLGEIGCQFSWGMINTYLTIFYTDVVGLTAAAISFIMLVARIWDAVNDPMMGVIADRTRTRWGKPGIKNLL